MAAAAADPSSSSVQGTRHPWSHVVRGEAEASSAVAPPSPSSSPPADAIAILEASDRSSKKPPAEGVPPSSSDAAAGKKQAWKRPPSGSMEAGSTVIGGASSWPALSESSKGLPKSSSSDALKPPSDGPISIPPEPAISPVLQKLNSNPSLSRNHGTPACQKSIKCGGSNSSSAETADGEVPQTSSPPTSLFMPTMKSDKQARSEHSPRNQTTKNTTSWDHSSSAGGSGSHPKDGGDHIRGGSNRRWNNGGGFGSHQNSNGRGFEHGGYNGYRRTAGSRDIRVPQRGARAYLRPLAPPIAPQFLNPPQVRPFGNPMVIRDVHSPIFYIATHPLPGGLPFISLPPVPPTMFVPPMDPQRANLLKQIDYYFSPENLCRDVYLRQNMDEQGWVPIYLIAGFNRVRRLTNNIEFILDTLRWSTVVEVQDGKIRKRHDWINWVLPPNNGQTVNADSASPATPDDLADRMQSIGIEDAAYQNIMTSSNSSDIFLGRSASGNLSNHLQVTANHNWNDNGQVIERTDPDRIKPVMTLLRSDTM